MSGHDLDLLIFHHVLEHHLVSSCHVFAGQNSGKGFHKCDFLTCLGQIDCGFTAYHTATDHYNGLTHIAVVFKQFHRRDGLFNTFDRRRHNRRGADRENDRVVLAAVRHIRRKLCFHVNGNVFLFQLGDIPVTQLVDFFLKSMRTGSVQLAAQNLGLLENLDRMAALHCLTGGFHARCAATDNGNASRMDRFFRKRIDLIESSGVDRTCGILAQAQIQVTANATHIAANAGTDLLGLAGFQLAGNIRVRQRGPSEHERISLTLIKSIGAQFNVIHLGTCNDGDVDIFLDLLIQIDAVAFLHIAGRACVVEGIISAGIRHDSGKTIVLQHLCDLDRLFDRSACLFITMEGCLVQRLDIALYAQTHGHREVLAASRLDTVNHFLNQTHLVFQRSTVFVFPLVGDGHHKLIQQVAPVQSVDVNSGKPGLLCQSRRFDDAVPLFMDLIHGQRFRCQLRITVNFRRRRRLKRGIIASNAQSHFTDHLGTVCIESLI